MNKYLNEKITPYVGTESFKLGMKLEEVRKILKENKIPFNQTEQSNKGDNISSTMGSYNNRFIINILFRKRCNV